MSTLRFLAIILIFGTVSVAWMVLGGTMWERTAVLDDRLSGEMQSLWGPKVLEQIAPRWVPTSGPGATDKPARAIAPSASRITADIRHTNRNKGLLWYSTFTVKFDGLYTIPAAESAEAPKPAGGTFGLSAAPAPEAPKPPKPAKGIFIFDLPKGVNGYDALSVALNDKPQEIPQHQIRAGRIELPFERTSENKIAICYTTNGQDIWLYSPSDTAGGGSRELARLSDFSLTIRTNFRNIDYPKPTRSPNTPADASDGGMIAKWDFSGALTNQAMGMEMPKRTNAGPIAARMSFFAPVSLLFFLTVLFTIVVLKRVSLHPMHFLFIAAGFFAFHILMAYLVDIISIHAAFWICALVSVVLVVSYMRLVAGVRFAVVYVGLAQLIYLVGFSYAFFWEGKTGLTVTIGAIATLFVLMQATGKVKWHEVFRKNPPAQPPPLARAVSAPPAAPDGDKKGNSESTV